MNIVVVAGGLSTERDVSLVSGLGIRDALRRKGHNVVLVDLFFGFGKRETIYPRFLRSLKHSTGI